MCSTKFNELLLPSALEVLELETTPRKVDPGSYPGPSKNKDTQLVARQITRA